MAGATSIRQSCDRCRGQKLRCERDEDGDTGACTRCIRQGSQCVYSYSLPKGRPNQYRLAGAADQNSFTNGTNPASKRRANTPISSEPHRPASAPRVNDTTATGPFPTFEAPNIRTQSRPRTNGRTGGLDDAALVEALTTYSKNMPLAAPTLPWLGHWGWSDLQLEEDGNEQPEDFNGLVGSGFQLQNTALDPLLDQQALPSQWATTGMKEMRGQLGTEPVSSQRVKPAQEQRHSVESDALEGRRDQNGTNDDSMSAMDTKGPGAAIAQLTQLSMRLHPLHNLSHALPDTAGSPLSSSADGQATWQSRQSLVADKALFGLIMTRLVQGWCDGSFSPPNLESVESLSLSSILQEALTASYYLLDIIERLQQNPKMTSGTSNSPLTPIPTPNGSDSGASSFKAGGQPSNTVVRHLVMACHGMLLSIYTAVFGVLQRDADFLSSMSHVAGRKASGVKAIEETRPLGDLHLVMLVQLCGYVIGRQQRAVASCISPQGPNAGADGFVAEPSAASAPNDLEAEMQQVLARLRQTLRVE
ncbi:hypothetical protein BDV96DRAFT_564716 [Lophiotrema nucula]|uniref:Zn(2)-C6 fungal-type domain-containing protein n=1 Tax=Lophiotrema nucula TaxID=690887 RepID=A0A6A5ZRS1_9PLEO|nr:hypothetical protein BDV96DRAFT_564716 [Lophiotrema nucula]